MIFQRPTGAFPGSPDRMAVFLLLLWLQPVPGTLRIVSPLITGSGKVLVLTDIGRFGLQRKQRPGISAHLHTGLDLCRPGRDFNNEPVLAVSAGTVISKREDGPFACLILEHDQSGVRFWSVYEHLAGITVHTGEKLKEGQVLGRLMNNAELNRYGWQFNHLHFELIKAQPVKLPLNERNPERRFTSFTLSCYSEKDLSRWFYDPKEILENSGYTLSGESGRR